MQQIFTPKAVLFDLDGTLIEFHKQFLFEETERLVDEAGLEQVSRDVLDDCFCDFDYFRWVEAARRDEFTNFFWKSFDFAAFPSPIPIEGARTALEALSTKGVACFIVTARVASQAELETELEATGFLPFLAGAIGRPGNHVDWQDKVSMIHSACQAAGVAPEETAMVGDIPPDIISAREAGVATCIAVKSGTIREHVLAKAKPDLILPSVASLPSTLFNGSSY
jgi:phosphoglycolate phosphatase-like HAD superfamily hydrolase